MHPAGGQVLTVAAPGNNAGGTLTTTYNYTSDPSYDANGVAGTGYTQNEQPGEPLTVTNPAGNVTHYRYDGRGNLILSIDAIGNKTNYVYNAADQMTQAIAPATNTATPTARALTQTNFGYTGGPATSEQVYDESGALVREVDTTYTADGEVASVTGSTEPASYTYDALSRVSTLTDGNGHVTHYGYDAVGNVSLIQYPGASGVFVTLSFTYDAGHVLLTKYQTKQGRCRKFVLTEINRIAETRALSDIGGTGTNRDSAGLFLVIRQGKRAAVEKIVASWFSLFTCANPPQ